MGLRCFLNSCCLLTDIPVAAPVPSAALVLNLVAVLLVVVVVVVVVPIVVIAIVIIAFRLSRLYLKGVHEPPHGSLHSAILAS